MIIDEHGFTEWFGSYLDSVIKFLMVIRKIIIKLLLRNAGCNSQYEILPSKF